MTSSVKSYVVNTICSVAALVAGLIALLIAGLPAAPVVAADGAMPTAQQNALVAKYCTICHTDAHPSGGLSLEHFDAIHPDPGVAAMLVSKLRAGALGAAGLPLPDKTVQDALTYALSNSAVGANQWTLTRSQNPATIAPAVTASIVQSIPSTKNAGEPDLYRLTLTCQPTTHEGQMQLAWSPRVPPQGQPMSAAVDGKSLTTYKIEGTERMGNGSESGPGSIVLYATKKDSLSVPAAQLPLPAQRLTISNPFPDQTVKFSFGNLTNAARQELSPCFGSEIIAQKH